MEKGPAPRAGLTPRQTPQVPFSSDVQGLGCLLPSGGRCHHPRELGPAIGMPPAASAPGLPAQDALLLLKHFPLCLILPPGEWSPGCLPPEPREAGACL